MDKRNELIVEHKPSLPNVITKVVKRSANFSELNIEEQKAVLDYIDTNNVGMRVFKYKWYDILSNQFCVVEYQEDDDAAFGVSEVLKTFDIFQDFFEYVNGDIYSNSCFYGYEFSKAEIEQFSIDFKSLNFDALIDETIDDCTFESVSEANAKSVSARVDRTKAIAKWFDRSKPISKLKDLEAKLNRFAHKFDFYSAKDVFFSILLRKEKNAVKEVAVEFACKHEDYDGLTFDQILLTYGKDAALYVTDHFRGEYSLFTRKKRTKEYRAALSLYESGTLSFRRKIGFDKCLWLYYVEDKYFDGINRPISSCCYFCTFSEFASYVNNDLSGADLSEAPISREEIAQYKIDENTKLPPVKHYVGYELNKKYANGEFAVKQRWTDENSITVLKKTHKFKTFFDFVHFLKRDLSGADLLFCDGIENIRKIVGLKLDGIKVRSDVGEKLGLTLQLLPKNSFSVKEFALTDKYELENKGCLAVRHPQEDDYGCKVSYISDIHLLHRFIAYRCRTQNDIDYVIKVIAKTLGEQATRVNLVAGDTSSDFSVFKSFIANLSISDKYGDYFFTLGNHELWGLNGENLDSIVSQYKKVLDEKGEGRMRLVHNNVFYYDGLWKEITEEELSVIPLNDLRAKARGAYLIIFGGIGFAGMNDEFNADEGIYMDVLDRDGEKAQSTKFLTLYEKVVSALRGRNLIVMTHMPKRDWGGKNIEAQDGVVYVSGHDHRNYFHDDGKKRIYADNQIGYTGKSLSFKQIAVDINYDWFADYKDGIYEISRDDYANFYRGIGECLTFNRQYEKLYMLKREGSYMFLMQAFQGKMMILNGGSIKNAGNHTLEYFYDNLANYSKSVNLFLSKYDEYQKRISKEIKRIGGDGIIHGAIVDIDFYNHLYINPLDGSITPYFAYSMIDKYVYDNIPSLLKSECPILFVNYEKLIKGNSSENSLIISNKNALITENKRYYGETDIYRISRILKGLQFTTKYNVVRLWNDAIIADASEQNGKLIVSNIIDNAGKIEHIVEFGTRETNKADK